MNGDELRKALDELARAELEDVALHNADASIEERMRSRDRLSRLRQHVDRLRDLAPAAPSGRALRRASRGVRLFPTRTDRRGT